MKLVRCGCQSHNGFLTAKGLEKAAQRELEIHELLKVGLTPGEESVRLDIPGSVSAMVEDEDAFAHVTDGFILEQEARFHNAS